jgi:hypothetical protein
MVQTAPEKWRVITFYVGHSWFFENIKNSELLRIFEIGHTCNCHFFNFLSRVKRAYKLEKPSKGDRIIQSLSVWDKLNLSTQVYPRTQILNNSLTQGGFFKSLGWFLQKVTKS